MPTININDIPEPKTVKLVDLSEDSVNKIAEAVIRKITEPTEEQVEEYCRKRNLVMINREPFNEMKARFSEDAVKHGHWKEHKDYPGLAYLCSDCGYFTTDRSYYCPYCGAKNEVEE